MKLSRRGFFKVMGATGIALAAKPVSAKSLPKPKRKKDSLGCLVDTTLCVGCRKCEQACSQRHNLPQPKESFEELTVLENQRRMD